MQVPQLQGYFGIIEGDTMDPKNSYVYFIKKFNRAIPQFLSMQETDAKIGEYVLVGSLTGEIFENLHRILNSVSIKKGFMTLSLTHFL